MRELSIDECKEMGLKTLTFFADFCDCHNLTYYLAYGTLLGAVRHQGYIPWDDDIDVWMPRKDYERLLELNHAFDQTVYSLQSLELFDEFLYPFSKLTRKDTVLLPPRFLNGYLYGCGIDIFPLDCFGTTDNYEVENRMFLSKYKYYKGQAFRYHYGTGGKEFKGLMKMARHSWYRLMTLMFGPVKPRVIDWAKMLYTDTNNDNLFFVASPPWKAVYEKKWFQNRVKMPFETGSFFVPEYYDAILRRAYGDYMMLPPEEERTIPHKFRAYSLGNDGEEE